MPPTLENPFTPKSAIPTKRLFGGEEKKRELSRKGRERIKNIENKVRYGEKMILKSQVEFLKEVEEDLIEAAKEMGRKLNKKDVEKKLAQRIRVDESGNIVMLEFHLMRLDFINLTSLPSLDKLKNLEKLYCFDNNLTSLPDLDKLNNLKLLDCHNNNLTSMPSLNQLKNLGRLICYGNEFSEQEKKEIKSQLPGKYIEI